MKRAWVLFSILMFFAINLVASAGQASKTPKDDVPAKNEHEDIMKLIDRPAYCIECHKNDTPVIFEEWVNSTHAKAKVSCLDCHGAEKGDRDAFKHAGKFYVRSVVTPVKCAKCHKDIQLDYYTSGHAQSLELLKEMKEDDPRYPVVSLHKQGNYHECRGCHGTEVKLDERNQPDPVTWPNSGAGRINPNTTHGTCSSCHLGHRFSAAAAREPETCTRCHDGNNYPEGDIYRHSVHGVAYETLVDKGDLNRLGWFFEGKDMVAPTCAFCHFNGSGHGLRTRHNGAWRLPRDLTHPEAPMALKNADNLRNNMKSVCNQCHTPRMTDSFFEIADKKLEFYQKTVVTPQLSIYQKKLESAEGAEKEQLLKEYSRFLAEAKRYRMGLYMGGAGRTQR